MLVEPRAINKKSSKRRSVRRSRTSNQKKDHREDAPNGAFFIGEHMKFIFLTKDFYEDYKHLKEIEIKDTRPYAMVIVDLNNLLFAIPLRSGISHKTIIQQISQIIVG